ncbi:BTB/POZ domain-containing protein At3g49900 [Impatiens glandulifera]|uniref:BTB/POZ domain-containing protein At3g49900 n=1 Tax=Impatiens glandulifera TaxID=253017 RepID=UPI001FB13758|nr:BTB/POZ domain-containing protein At3g49900 [Impatiens glandulifera]
MKPSWNGLGMVETIYEDEDLENDVVSTSSTLSVSPSPSDSRVVEPRLLIDREADVLVHVEDSHFYLHKDILISKSGYFNRQLKGSSEITISPPLKIKADTFTLITDFCYGSRIVITPFNVVDIIVAAEQLELTSVDDDEDLLEKADTYFRQFASLSDDYASVVFRSCLSLLPESEITSFLVSRCIHALSLTTNMDHVLRCIDEIKTVKTEQFELIVEALHHRLMDHDLIYRIIDLHLQVNGEKLTEEKKTRLCNFIDCGSLSPAAIMNAVQNPRMPLRFMVQAMFIEQLNTRRALCSAAKAHPNPIPIANTSKVITLGSILRQDASNRQVGQLREAMDVTSSRIQSLEEELGCLKEVLRESENRNRGSVSFRMIRPESKIDRGSVSSTEFRGFPRRGKIVEISNESSDGSNQFGDSSTSQKQGMMNFRKKLMMRLKNAFRRGSSSGTETKMDKKRGDEEFDGTGGGGVGEVFMIKKKEITSRRR